MKMNSMKLAAFAIGMAAMPALYADDPTTVLNVTVAPEAVISSATASQSLTKSGTDFANAFTGSSTFNYKVRTLETGGSGAVTATATAFGTGGPTLADLTYTSSTTALAAGTPTGGTNVTASASGTAVLTFGADNRSLDAGNVGTINWTLADRPTYKTGDYSTTVTLTISAT